ncbi:type III-B CRISPR-associated protein Cas10/Cmr2 [Methanosarcina sp. DH1]|uniref:type III-B CRISPR-associated protein Cas10/Cmr2 n=1 Tax=Methanosarcina sp. DH1 TaxID=2605695 RepID=UPI001E2A9BC0|nr:type III-B CRISPR-associated protein Cas10/Cmr2 [Methanosarcina sp. DH1]MCC4766889.1 type III-B CRISPR-associated protein Cas10/Cmr2 [Methanosarcina sp. DH1]
MNELIEQMKNYGNEFYLLRVSIGPVQEFISESRKTRDLYIGSRLLSLATFKTMRPIFDAYGLEAIIYPHIKSSKERLSSLPNIYMAVIPKSKLDEMLSRMKNGLNNFWDEVQQKVNENLPLDCKGYYGQKIRSPFYMNWVAVPVTIEELNNTYKPKVKEIIHFFNERKVTRTFDSWEGSYVQKCNQCGHREYSPEIYLSIQKKFKNRIRENEILCSVCLLKRLLNPKDIDVPDQKFDSVMDVSAAIAKKLMEKGKKEKHEIKEFTDNVDRIGKMIGNTQKNGEYYYEDYLNYDFFKKEYGIADDPEFRELCDDTKYKLRAAYESLGIKEPSKYYSILMMDGDNMGKLMSGDVKLTSGEVLKDTNFTLDFQKKLSEILSYTGSNTSELIKNQDEGNGLCVYSGGDDLLAFLPLETSLSTTNKSRSCFIDEFRKSNIKQTFSAGIVLLHHKDPLRRGLEDARQSVEKAKGVFKDKDAFCITLRLFSGSVVAWIYKWEINVPNLQELDSIKVLDVLRYFVSFMLEDSENKLSPSFVRDFMEELTSFYKYNENKSTWSLNEKMFKSEFWRLLKRHMPSESKLWKEEFRDGILTLDLIAESFVYMADPEKNKQVKHTKENFENFLQIALFLVREQIGGDFK